jgi:hypothetical protein
MEMDYKKKKKKNQELFVDNNPLHIFEPTIQMVDKYHCNQDYCNKTIRDLGVSAKGEGNVTD